MPDSLLRWRGGFPILANKVCLINNSLGAMPRTVRDSLAEYTDLFPVEFVELEPASPTAIGPGVVTAFEVDHASGAPAYALRVALAGKVIAYSGDTSWTPSLFNAASGADLFSCEAYSHDQQVPFHLNYLTLVERASEFDCRRIILTRMTQDMLDRDHLIFERVDDGLEIRL